jgi:DNA-binding PadR family transcriptional regulator
MKIPLYILGLLLRFGPQHGYQIKKIFEDQLSDFTRIKLPTIYYHLEKMQKAGLLSARTGKESKRPEKTVYAPTGKGEKAFHRLLNESLQFDYRPSFASDAVFYFFDTVEKSSLKRSLQKHCDELRQTLASIEKHKGDVLRILPVNTRKAALTIFNRHERHYRAESDWVVETLANL